MNYFNTLRTAKGFYLLIGTTEQAKAYRDTFQTDSEQTTELETYYLLGTQRLDKADLSQFDSVIIL